MSCIAFMQFLLVFYAIIFSVIFCLFSGWSTPESMTEEKNHSDDLSEADIEPLVIDRGPYFDKTASSNVTALVGKTAYLNCRIRNVGNKTVSIANTTKKIR